MNVAEMKQAGKGQVNAEASTRKGNIAKGHALAQVCVNFATEEMKAEEKRGEKRMGFVKRIADLTPEGHAEFRKELQHALAFLDEQDKAAMAAGALKEAPSKTAGYSLASFRVMVSNWRTVSVACEAGMKIEDGASWENTLEEARATRKAHQSNGGKVIEGTKKQGAGRKAISDYDKALRIVSKLGYKDLVKLQSALTGLIEASAPKARKPKADASAPAAAA